MFGRKKFRKEFGFDPFHVYAVDDRPWQQIVDFRLTQSAKQFAFWDESERRIHSYFKAEGQTCVVPVKEFFQSLRVVRKQLEKAKKEFWATHKLVKKIGFAVKEKHSDYLEPRVKVLPDNKPAIRVKVLPD